MDADTRAHLALLAGETVAEAMMACDRYLPFTSAHEGWAVLREEVDELWDEVKKSPRKRDAAAMRREAVQVAAMALRFLLDVCDRDEIAPSPREGTSQPADLSAQEGESE